MANIKKIGWLVMAVAIASLAMAGCDDGELASGMSPNITPASPIIISFYADPSAISQGESTTISWEVAGADKVEIAAVASDGSAVSFGVSTDQLSGSQAVNGLTANTDFVLTATKETESLESETEEPAAMHVMGGQIQFGPEQEEAPPAPEPTPDVVVSSSVTQTITVTVSPAGQLTATITADSSSVALGDSTIIRWTVSPSDDLKAVGVIADSGEAISPVAAENCTGTMEEILAQPAPEQFPANGCAVVSPEALTNYTINAQDNAGNQATASARVDVAGGAVTAKIFAAENETATPEDNLLMVSSWKTPVVVSWQVSPAEAKVTVTAEGSIGTQSTDAPCALPNNATGQTSGSTKCMLGGETTFKITAAIGSAVSTDEVAVVKAGSSHAGLVVPQTWAFVGESIPISVALDSETKADPSAVAGIKIGGQALTSSELESVKTSSCGCITKEAVVGLEGVPVDLMVEGASQAITYHAIKPVPVSPDSLSSSVERVTSHAFAGIDTIFTGVELTSFNSGKARIYKNGRDVNFNFYDIFIGMSGSPDIFDIAFFENERMNYPAVVAVKDDDPNKVLAAVPGVVLYSSANDDNGDPKFNDVLMVSPIMVGSDYVRDASGGYMTCGYDTDSGVQKIQKYPSGTLKDGDLIGMSQTCDMATKGKYVVVAMDWGVFVDVDMEDGEDVWNGFPPEGKKGSDPEVQKPMFGHVVNALEKAGEKIFAAADNGVFVSPPSSVPSSLGKPAADFYGIRWDTFGTDLQQTNVFALAYDEATETLYAGTADSLYKTKVGSGNSASWEYVNTISGPVLSIAVDPASSGNTIIVGTDEGLKVSRNGGESWADVALSGGAQPVESVAIKAEDNGAGKNYRIAIGSTKGEIRTDPFYVGATASAPIVVKMLPIGGDTPPVDVERR